ncbi:hypothetical protein [Streptomyces sp. HD]|uniref:hypothetical protein n=1 Tax=Streptomyces sp. HD TaxID=3020892 RepID=UPI002330016D|nr:hypothetical protein [Streptomyces sp. HD]MDC0766087.1 hypothetical protein [Streptomyces sp. HD]
MNTPHAEPRPIAARVSGAAATGAVLAGGACLFFSWVGHHNDQSCETTDGLCFTWWDLAALPLTFATALVTLIVVYKQLGIGPRLAVIPPTLLLAPIPLAAAQATAGCWAAAIAGGAWASFFALAASSRYRILGLSAAAALLLASLVVLYR